MASRLQLPQPQNKTTVENPPSGVSWLGLGDDLIAYSAALTEQHALRGDVFGWVCANRHIAGSLWSYDSPGPKIDLGKHDIMPHRLYRPYLEQYVRDQAPVRSVIKCRQCLVPHATIFTRQDGQLALRTVESLFNSNYRGEILYSVNEHIQACRVENIWASGVKPILEITLHDGHKLECSDREKIWVPSLSKFVLAQNLTVGMELSVMIDSFGTRSLSFDPGLLGYMYSDGSYFTTGLGRKVCYFRNRNFLYAQEFQNMIGDAARLYKFQAVDTRVAGRKPAWTYDVYVKPQAAMRQFLDSIDACDVIGADKQLPDICMELNRADTARLLNRLFAGDGYYHTRLHKAGARRHEIGIGSMSYAMLVQIQHLLSRFGIDSVIKESMQKTSKSQFWKLMVSARRSHVLRFMESIGIFGKIEAADIQRVRAEIEETKIYRHRQEHAIIAPNSIVSIRRKSAQKTYDICVSDKTNHRFFANGILVSNSEYSENQINEELYYALTRPHTNILHVFPVDDIGDAFSNDKIMPGVKESPKIALRARAIATRRYAFDNGSNLRIQGAMKKSGGRAGSMDLLTFDEVDKMPNGVFGVYEQMLSHSSLRLVRYISTPTTPMTGIDAKVKDGSGFHWWWKCHACGEWQQFVWPDNLIGYFEPSMIQFDKESPEYQAKLDEVYLGCSKCKAYVDRSSEHYRQNSKWIAERPALINRHTSYHVVAGMIPWKTGKELLSTAHDLARWPHVFLNEAWGVAYIKGEHRLDLSELYQLQRNWQMPTVRTSNMHHVAMGIDHGETQSWVVVTAGGYDPHTPELRCVVYIEEISQPTLARRGFTHFSGLEHVDRMKQLIQAWRPECVVSDSVGIGSDRTVALARAFPRIVWGGMFDTAEAQRQLRHSKMLVPRWSSDERRTVTFSKVTGVKDLMNEIRSHNWAFPRAEGEHAPTVELFFQHMTALGIQPRVEVGSDQEFEVVAKLHPGDHLFACMLYAHVAWSRLAGFKSSVPGVV